MRIVEGSASRGLQLGPAAFEGVVGLPTQADVHLVTPEAGVQIRHVESDRRVVARRFVGRGEDKADDAPGIVGRDPRLARAGAIAAQRVERLLACECVDAQRDLGREAQQQGVDLGGIAEPGGAIGERCHAISRSRPDRGQTSAA